MMHQPFPPANEIQPSAGRADEQFDQGEVLYVEVHARERCKTNEYPHPNPLNAYTTTTVLRARPFKRFCQ